MFVLVVDDNSSLRKLIVKNLEINAYQTLEAPDTAEAKKILEESFHEIKVIFLDLMMPGKDGRDFLLEIRKDVRFKDIKICIVSALFQMDVVKECLRKGADDYLVKPFDSGILLDKVNRFFQIEAEQKLLNINAQISCQLLRDQKNNLVEITSISEGFFNFRVDVQIPIGARVQLKCDFLNKVLKFQDVIVLRVEREKTLFESSRFRYEYKAVIIGMNSKTREELVKLIFKNKEIIEVNFFAEK